MLEITGVLNIWQRKSATDGNNTFHVKNVVVKWCSWQYCSCFLNIPASYLGRLLCAWEPHHKAHMSILTCSENGSENWLYISNKQETKIYLLGFHNSKRHFPISPGRGFKVFSDEEKLQFRLAINGISLNCHKH